MKLRLIEGPRLRALALPLVWVSLSAVRPELDPCTTGTPAGWRESTELEAQIDPPLWPFAAAPCSRVVARWHGCLDATVRPGSTVVLQTSSLVGHHRNSSPPDFRTVGRSTPRVDISIV